MMFNKLCVLMLTYNRLDYATRTLRAVLDNLRWSGELHVHIGSDGDTREYTDKLQHLAGSYGHVHSVGVSNSERRGYGYNYNLATQAVHSYADLVLQIEDDWELTKKLNIDDLSSVFADSSIGCIRLGYLSFTQPIYGKIVRVKDRAVITLDPRSAEHHIWAGHPQLCTVDWQRTIGPWPEGLSPQETEYYVSRFMARQGIVWDLGEYPAGNLFTHIGSVRASVESALHEYV